MPTKTATGSIPSDGLIAHQQAVLDAIQKNTSGQITSAFADAIAGVMPSAAKFRSAYTKELQHSQAVLEDQGGAPEDARVSLYWLHTSGFLDALLRSLQDNLEKTAKQVAPAIQDGYQQAQAAGKISGVAMVAQTAGVPISKVQLAPPQPTRPTPRQLLQQAMALDEENQPEPPEGVDETIDAMPQRTSQKARESLLAGAMLGMNGQMQMMGVQTVLQGALTSMMGLGENVAADAMRQGALVTIASNPALVDGWIWAAEGGACIACIEMDGSFHTWDEPFDSHPNCGCSPVPYSGPASGLDDYAGQGEDWFTNELGDAEQAEILGPSKYLAWKNGDFQLFDLVSREGGYVHERSLKELGLDFRDYLSQLPTKRELLELPDISLLGPHEAGVALTAEEEQLLADAERAVMAYAPEFPEIPEIKIPEPLDMTANPEVKFIAEKDVAAWTASNAEGVPDIGYHYGTQRHIDKLEREGIDVERNRVGAAGKGFYMFSGEQREPGRYAISGEAFTRAAVHVEHPYVVDFNAEEWAPRTPLETAFGNFNRYIQSLADPEARATAEAEVADIRAAYKAAEARGDSTAMERLGEQWTAAEEKLDLLPGAAFTQKLLDEGYDGVLLKNVGPRYEQFRDEVIAIKPGTVRVINDAKAAEAEAKAATEATTAREVSPEVRALQDQRAALQAQRDAIQAKQDVLSARWAKIVRETDFTEPDEAAAAEKKLTNIEKQQANNIQRMDKLDTKMAKLDEKIATEVRPAEESAALQKLQDTRATLLAKAQDLQAKRDAAAATTYKTEKQLAAAQEAQQRRAEIVNYGDARKDLNRVFGQRVSDDQIRAMLRPYAGDTIHIEENYGEDSVAVRLEGARGIEGEDIISFVFQRDEDGNVILTGDVGIEAGSRGLGSGLDVLKGLQNMSDMGVTRVDMFAGRYPGQNGYDSWAKLGATGDIPTKALGTGRNVLAEAQAVFGTDVTRVEQLMDLPGGPAWWRANGDTWKASFDLRPGSQTMEKVTSLLSSRDKTPDVFALKVSDKQVAILQKQQAAVETKIATLDQQIAANQAKLDAAEANITRMGATLPAPVAEAASAAGDMGLPELTYTLPEIDQKAEDAIIQQAQDVLASGGVASHEDILALGQPIKDYLNERIGPLADWAADANKIYNSGGKDLSGDLIAWLQGDTTDHGGLTVQESLEQYQAAMQQETIRLVDEVRGVGSTELDVADGAPAALEDMLHQVESALPTDWLDASNDGGEVTLLNETSRRGYYRSDSQSTAGTIGLRNNASTTPGQLYTATVHELGHRMEDSVEGVWQAERDFYNARTENEAWKAIDPKLGVAGRTKKDDFANEYLGKDPIQVVRGGGLPAVEHYELFSSGLEWMLGTNWSGANMLSKDEEFHQWLLGLLFGAKGKG